VSINVSEEHIASIFRAKEISSARNACHLLALWFLAEIIYFTLMVEQIFIT
jgi:hypothetical protein